MDEVPDKAEALDDRLRRLAARRRVAARRQQHSTSSSEEGEAHAAPASRLPHGGALHALHELLQERQAALQAAGTLLAGGDGAARACGPLSTDGVTTEPAAVAATAAAPCSPPEAKMSPSTATSLLARNSRDSGSGPHSMPTTARTLISLGTAIGQQEAQAERQARTAEAREAEAAVREAEAQRAELEALLLRQEAAAAERERQRLEREDELQRVQLELATHHMAAWRIAQAWRRFLRSPGRRREMAAATTIQAAWRGCASRRRTAALMQQHREQRALLSELRAAVAACDLAQARSIAGRLGAEAGGATAVTQLLAGLERRAAEAADALSNAAVTGTVEAYHAAAAAAAPYAHLAGAVQEAAVVFAGRVAAAEQAVAQAVEGGPAAMFSQATAAAASLGVSHAMLLHAEQRVAARNQQAAEALQAALDAEAFDAAQFGACLQRVRQLGLHAAAARAERGLQLRRHRATAALQQVAAEGSAAEVEALCRSAAQLGLSAEADGAAARLEQRQAAVMGELRQAAHSGTLQQYQAAAGQAEALRVSPAVQRTCREQMWQRQQEAEQQVRQAADRGELSTVRRRCQAALALGLGAVVAEAEQRVNERRMAAAEQLAAATRGACEFAEASQCSDTVAKQLAGWLADAQQLAGSIAEPGAAAALARPPPASMGWPAELRCWLVDATRAAGLELERAVATAATTLVAHLQAVADAAVMAPVQLQPADMLSSGSGTGSPMQQGSAGRGQHVHASLQQWRALQQDVLPLVAALAAEEGHHSDEAAGGGSSADEEGKGSALDLSGQGLCCLDLLDGGSGSGITHLDLSGNLLSSLEPLSALHGLRALRVASSGLGSLRGVEALSQLTYLDASGNALERLPSLEALTALRALDLSSNRLTGGALLAADFPACGARLTALCLRGNCLADVASWMGPLPSLLHLDVSGNEVESLDGLAAAAPLLQVLVGSRNRVATLPPALHLPFLRELWLGGNRLSSAAAWPWLPSLQLLQLEDNQLAQLAPLQGFPSLRVLDLSFNALPSLHAALASLAPLGAPAGGLQQLRLNDNPLSGGAQQHPALWQARAGGLASGDAGGDAGYRRAVLQALPQLRELDSQPIPEAERQQHLQTAAVRTAAVAGAVAGSGAGAVGKGAAAERQARTVLWLLTQPGALEALEESEAQQQALAAASFSSQVDGHPAAAPGAQGVAAALAALKQAAACGLFPGQQGRSCTNAAVPRGSRAAGQPQLLLRRLQQLYLLLARDETGAAEDLLWLNPEHYQELLSRLTGAATRIQAAWRRLRALRLRQRLAAERRAHTVTAAAACIQAVWRGWVCRHRSHRHIPGRLAAWRREWREAQRLVAEHQRSGAAVRIQAAWRGWRVRRLLAQARQALRQHSVVCGAAELPGVGSRQADWELDLELSTGSLDGLLEGGASSILRACEAPEALLPQLAVAAVPDMEHGAMPALPPWGCAGSIGGSSGTAGGSISYEATAAPSGTAPLQLPPLSAAEQSPAPVPGPGSDWQFEDPATAATYLQLRQRQVAAVRKRALQQQRRDPSARLQEFQMRNGAGLPSCGTGTSSPQQSRGGSGSRSSGQRGGRSGSGCGSLPSLKSPRAERAARQVALGVRTVQLDG